MWRSVLCVSVVCGLALDSNTIRSSKEASLQSSELPRGGCSNRAQRKAASVVERQRDRDRDRDVDRQTDSSNRTKAQEMSSCVRSGDCAAGLCCARYLTGKRCQRIPVQGEACLLLGSTKRRRNLDRCACEAGLSCTAVDRANPGKHKRQGVCAPRHGLVRSGAPRRKSRHSGKRRTEETSC